MNYNSICFALGVGQLFCFFLALSGAFSKQLQLQSLSTPFLNAMLAYSLMMALNISGFKQSNFSYLFVLSSLADVGGQVTSIIAYQNTLISNVAILSVCGAVTAAFQSVIIFKAKYSFIHFISFVLCFLGIVLKFSADSIVQRSTGSVSLYGDCMAALSSILYATSSFISQILLNQGISNTAINFRLGKFGLLFTLIMFFAFQEYKVLTQNPLYVSSYFLYCGYALAGYLSYFFSIISIQKGGATAYNLIGLSKMVYTMLFDYFFFGSTFRFIDIAVYALVLVGMGLFYSKKPARQLKEIQMPLLEQISVDTEL